MQRDLRRLSDGQFDLIVVGAGIYGTAAAWDASLRGLSVAIVDRSDFGGGTSFNSLKTVHGGIRELQSGNIAGLRKFVRERRALSRVAPHLVHPLPFVIPTYKRVSRHRWIMRVGFAINDLLAHDRNDLADSSKHLPPSRLLSRKECLTLNPLIEPDGVTGGIEWHDCQMYNSDRVNLSFLLSAVAKGAVPANYVECVGILRRNRRIEGIVVRDRLGTEQFDVRGRVVLNGTGPWATTLLNTIVPELKHTLPQGLSSAMNMVLSRPMHGQHALGGPAASRLLFVAPWRGLALVGTSHEPFSGAPDSFVAKRSDIEHFISGVNQAFPRLNVGIEDVRLLHRGLLPTQATIGGAVQLLKASAVRDHRVDGIEGLLTVLGVRYTTARDTAHETINTVFSLLDRTAPPCRTNATPLVGGDIKNFDEFLRLSLATETPGVSQRTRRRLALSYGTTHKDLLDALQSTPSDRTELGSSCPITRAEVRHAVRHEMAVKLSDAVLRRTEAGSAGHPGNDALRTAAAVMSEELGWSPERVDAEIIDTTETYVLPHHA